MSDWVQDAKNRFQQMKNDRYQEFSERMSVTIEEIELVMSELREQGFKIEKPITMLVKSTDVEEEGDFTLDEDEVERRDPLFDTRYYDGKVVMMEWKVELPRSSSWIKIKLGIKNTSRNPTPTTNALKVESDIKAFLLKVSSH